MNLDAFVGRAPESLSTQESSVLAGRFVALEIYSPSTRPLRRIAAVGDSTLDCMRQIARRGFDPRRYEFIRFRRPY